MPTLVDPKTLDLYRCRICGEERRAEFDCTVLFCVPCHFAGRGDGDPQLVRLLKEDPVPKSDLS